MSNPFFGGLNGDDFFYGSESSVENELLEQEAEDQVLDSDSDEELSEDYFDV